MSGYADQPVDQIDFENLSDDELKNIAENDTRSTAQDKANAELNSRNGGGDAETGETVSGDVTAEDLENVDPGDKLLSLQPTDGAERAAALGLNSEGINTDPDAGQAQLQAYANAVEESGTIPPTGSPPDDSNTVKEVVKTAAADKEARIEAMRENLSK